MKTREIFKVALFLFVMFLLLPGCSEDNTQELKDQERTLLEKYLKEENITQEPTASGLYYIPITEGTGDQVGDEFFVDIEFKNELIDGTVLETSNEELAKEQNLYVEGIMYGPSRTRVGYTGRPGLDEGLQFMKEGGKAKLILPSDINGFGGTPTALSPSYSTHIWTVEIIHAFDDPVSFEAEQISLYLSEQAFDRSLTTETGLYYIELQAGEGNSIKDESEAKLWFKGMFLDGRVFESNLDSYAVSVHMPEAAFILYYTLAWDEILTLLMPGTKAIVIIPYELAFGAYGDNVMPPYMTLVYELEAELPAE